MKKIYVLLIITAVLFTACGSRAPMSEELEQSYALEFVNETEVSDEEEIFDELETHDEEEIFPEYIQPEELPSVYTIEQIQIALEQQFLVNGYVDPQVISAQRVVREIDGFWWESAQEYLDISNSARYRVEVRHSQSLEEYNIWAEIYANSNLPSPFRRDGDYTITTWHYHFNDENGTPILTHVAC